jgi:hypothetical protein
MITETTGQPAGPGAVFIRHRLAVRSVPTVAFHSAATTAGQSLSLQNGHAGHPLAPRLIDLERDLTTAKP